MTLKSKVKSFVENNPNLVSMKPQGSGLYVLKYKQKVFYDNLWTDELMYCRGTVVDENFDIVQKPFKKIFNYGENGTTIACDEFVIASRKINGFMCAVTMHNGEMLVSTTGSTNSEYVELAKRMISQTSIEDKIDHPILSNMTWMFEIVSPEDPHIIRDEYGVYLLDANHKVWDELDDINMSQFQLDIFAKTFNCLRPEWWRCEFGRIVDMSKTCRHEGFVCRGESTSLKIKSPYYLIKKFFARIRGEKLDGVFQNGESSLRKKFDEEYYPLISYIKDMGETFTLLDEQSRLRTIEKFLMES